MIRPKQHQTEALQGLTTARRRQQKRALVIMASGLGKTITAALDAQRYKRQHPNARFLFLCHQNDILEQAQVEFARVFPLEKYTMGFFHGQQKDTAHEIDFLFASFQTMREWRTSFKKREFDYLIVDESHHSPAPTYEPTIEYFQPKFTLALTATPERTDLDDIRRIYGQEVYNLPLEDALARGLLTRIDYRLVTDEIAYEKILDTPVGKLSVKNLNTRFFIRKRDEEIVKIIQRRIRRIKRAKVMIFCRTTAHCDRLAKLMPNAVAIHHNMVRSEQKLRLQQFREGSRGIVPTVDMFNEGIDIPEANVIVFLRSTAAPIVFYQQLGRGLRESHGKEKVIVLDFVANCERLVMLDGLFKLVHRRRKEIGAYEKMDPFNVNVGKVQFTEAAQKVLEILRRVRQGYTKELLVAQLAYLAEKMGRTPKEIDLEEASKRGECASPPIFRSAFGSIAEAVRAAGLEVGYQRYTKDQLLKQLKTLASELGHPPSVADIKFAARKQRCASEETFRRQFGSVPAALKAAGLETSRFSKSRRLTKEDLIGQLQGLARELGRTPIQADIKIASKQGKCASWPTFISRFGSMPAAYRAAGLEETRGCPSYTREELLKQLRRLRRELGRPPKSIEIEKAAKKGECASTPTFRKEFGSIGAALKAARMKPHPRQKVSL